jgi:hypothetical protein
MLNGERPQRGMADVAGLNPVLETIRFRRQLPRRQSRAGDASRFNALNAA